MILLLLLRLHHILLTFFLLLILSALNISFTTISFHLSLRSCNIEYPKLKPVLFIGHSRITHVHCSSPDGELYVHFIPCGIYIEVHFGLLHACRKSVVVVGWWFGVGWGKRKNLRYRWWWRRWHMIQQNTSNLSLFYLYVNVVYDVDAVLIWICLFLVVVGSLTILTRCVSLLSNFLSFQQFVFWILNF